MVWGSWKAYMTSLRPGIISKHSKQRRAGRGGPSAEAGRASRTSDRWRRKLAFPKRGEKRTGLSKAVKAGRVKPG